MLRLKSLVLEDSFTLKAIFAFVLISVILMVLLFPKGRIERIILESEEVNPHLTKRYILALLNIDPPSDLKFALLKRYALLSNREEIERIKNILDNETQFLYTKYYFLKRKYFEGNKHLKKEIKKTLAEFVKLETDKKMLEEIFEESVNMNLPQIAFNVAKKLAEETKEDLWKERAFIYAVYSGKTREARKLSYAFKPSNKNTWLLLYAFEKERGKYKRAHQLLRKYISLYPEEKNKLLEELMATSFIVGNHEEGGKILNHILKGRNHAKRKRVISKALMKIKASGNTKALKEFIRACLPFVPSDSALIKEIVKSALETGDPVFASDVSQILSEKIK